MNDRELASIMLDHLRDDPKVREETFRLLEFLFDHHENTPSHELYLFCKEKTLTSELITLLGDPDNKGES
jgi:hypothetical protein